MPSTQLICPACSHESPEGARFCAQCGGALASSCGACGAELLASARYCSACGAPVHSPGAGTGRKIVTALFADLAGSTALQEALDVESTRSVMALYYECMSAVIEEHKGRLEKFIGDAVVAIFGAPVVREDDALRAVRAAAEMGSALDRLNEQLQRDWGVRLQMRIGVNTGELVLAHGSDSSQGATDGGEIVVGDVMNTAARLEQAAGAGEVLIGEETRRLVRDAVELESVAPLDLKGKSEPVPAFRLVSIERPREKEEMTTATPLIGRHPDLTRLRAALDDAIKARACRLVTVIGSPGVGKTRLASELARALGDEASVVEGHCEPSGEGITLLPVAEVLRGLASIGEADPPEIVREKLGALLTDEPDRERLLEPIAGVLGISAAASAQETFWALRRCLELLSRRRPIVIVLDDLHWGQPMFLDLLEHLVEWVSDAPVLLLALARPELREVREALTSGRRASEVIELAPLDDDQSEALVSELLGGAQLPQALMERILASSEGNPLFLGEMLRMLIDDGVLQRDGEEWVAGAELASVEVPPTIHALLSARIERLDSDERSVVERAAVIGKEFYRGAVAELVAPPVKPRIDGHLEALRRKDMVEPDGTYWIDEPVYRFHHVLIRDAAYRSLLKEARAELHERFADWLKEKAGELVGEHEEVIAYHLEQAHAYRRQLGPLDDRSRALGARAAQRLHSVGTRALEREDLAAAANLLTRALECDAGDEHAILWELCEALLSAGDTSNAARFVERFTIGAGNDPVRCARARVLQAQLANLGADRTAGDARPTAVEGAAVSAQAVENAARTLAELDDSQGEAKAWQVAASVHARLGQVGAAEEALDRALAAARAADDKRRVTAVLTGAPRAALWGPSPVVRASGRCLDVVRILRMSPGNRHVEAIALRCQAVLEAMRGRFDAAREILTAGRATLQELGLTLELQESALHAGIVELLAGDTGAAVNHLREAREGFESIGVASGAAQAAAMLARALIEQGEGDDEAIEQTRFAESHGGEDLKTTITWCSARAQVLAHTGEIEQSLSLAQRAVALAQPTDALADKADTSMALAQVLLAAGRKEEAIQTATAARELYEAKGHTVGVQRAARLIGTSGPSQSRSQVAASTVLGARAGEPGRAAKVTPSGRRVMSGERAPERFWATFRERANARDYVDLSELFARDVVLLDHRPIGWEDARGREQVMAIMHSTFDASPDVSMEFDEVLACDERVIAVRMALRGQGLKAGELEVPLGAVLVVDDGLWTHADYYEPHDREAMQTRYRELGGRGEMLGARPPERYLANYTARFAAHDLDGLLALHAEDCVLMDHRMLSWETARGRSGVEEQLRSLFASPDITLEVDRVLACDDCLVAVSLTGRGTTLEGGGEFEGQLGVVIVIEDGLLVSSDYYEHDEHQAMLARYAELGGHGEGPATRPPEGVPAEFARRLATRDVEGLLELFAEDYVLTDHRGLGWETIRGREKIGEGLRAFLAAAPNVRYEVDEVLACDERVMAHRVSYRGEGDVAGSFDYPVGVVAVVKDGRWVSGDLYEPEDRTAMIAHYAELGGGQGPLGERPPERHYAEFIRRFAARDIEALLELFTEGWIMEDHRVLGWEPLLGGDSTRQGFESAYSMSPEVRIEVEEVLACEEHVIALRVCWCGRAVDGWGDFAIPLGQVVVVDGGHGVRLELYDPDDREAILERFAELCGDREMLGDRPPERFVANWNRLFNAHDLERLLALHAEDWVLVDHRRLGWETTRGWSGAEQQLRSGFISPDIRVDVHEVLACDERVIAQCVTASGTADVGGGKFELPLGVVNVIEGGLLVSSDYYEPEDRAAVIARYAELGGGQRPLGNRPPERHFVEYAQRFGARDIDGMLGLLVEDFTLLDHRAIGWEPIRGHEPMRTTYQSVFTGTFDNLLEIEEVLACDEHVIAFRASYHGSARYGDHLTPRSGEYAFPFGYVAVIEQGRCISADQYEPDDRNGILARFQELSSRHRVLGNQPPERFVAAFLRHWETADVAALVAAHSEDFVLSDHRRLGWEPMGRDDAESALHSYFRFASSSDVRLETDDVLACDDRVIAIRATLRGEGAKVGQLDYSMGLVCVIEDGLLMTMDLYEPDDRKGMLARYADLGGTGVTLIERVEADSPGETG